MSFEHFALLYDDEAAYLEGTVPFVREGLEGGEAVLVAVPEDRRAALRDALGADAGAVSFIDMPAVGRNPGRIISVWNEFVAEQRRAGRPFRGIGEPAWRGRSPDELEECRRHEALLNVAFGDGPSWKLMCPYDTAGLAAEVVAGAHCTHPHVERDGRMAASDAYLDPDRDQSPFAGELPAPPPGAAELRFTHGALPSVRAFAFAHGRRAGLPQPRVDDLVLALNELATNSLLHAAGLGVIRAWENGGGLVVEVEDGGRIERPLTGRMRPSPAATGGRGVWMVNQLCDLVQIRSGDAGTVIRLHMDA